MRKACQILLLLIVIVLLSGCASYEIRPPAASIETPKAPSVLPVTVGISKGSQKLSSGFSDVVLVFKDELERSGLFKIVYYPVRPDDKIAGSINLAVTTEFKMDPVWFPKAFFSGFFMFIPVPFTWYNHQFHAEATLQLSRDGKPIKTYSSKQVAIASVQLLAPEEKVDPEGAESATKLLTTDLIRQLLNDREFIEKELTPALKPE